MNVTFNTYAEQLHFEVDALKRISRENEFSQYLFAMDERVNLYPNMALSLRQELISNYQIYVQRMRAQGINIPESIMAVAYPGMDAPVVLEPFSNQVIAAPQPVQPQPVQQMPAQPQVQPVQQMPVQPQVQPVQQMPTQPAPSSDSAVAPKKNRFEFAVGGIVLSVLGVVLILFGFIMLAVNFFDSIWQGICLYVVCAFVFAFSEFLVKRVVPKLSYVLTSFSFAGLFVVTMVNYFALDLFNFWIALVILLAITIAIAVFSYLRKSFLFAVIGYVSTFVVLGLIGEVDSEAQIYMLFGTLIAAQIFWIAFPVSKNGYALSIVQLVGNIVFLWFCAAWEKFITLGDVAFSVKAVIAAVSFLAECLILFLSSYRYFGKEEDHNPKDAHKAIPVSILLGSYALTYFALLYDITLKIDELQINIISICNFVVLLLPTIGLSLLLKNKGRVLWQQFVFLGTILCLAPSLCITVNYVDAILVVIVCLADTMLAKLFKTSSLKALDTVMKVFLVIITVASAYTLDCDPAVIIYLVGIMAEIVIGAGFHIPSYIMLTGAFTWGLCVITPHNTWLMIMSGILMASIFAFHNVKWLKSKYILVYDICALTEFVVVLGLLNHPFYSNNMLPMLVVFVFGIGILLQYLQKSYGMPFAGNIMPLAIYLSYFVLVLRIEEAVVTSAILILVALICVALGFLMKQKSVRIFGLVLAMLVCAKLVFYDFWNAASLVKTIMYFVVGILVLVIAGVYIVVEMLIAKKANKEVENQNVQ